MAFKCKLIKVKERKLAHFDTVQVICIVTIHTALFLGANFVGF